MIGMYIMLGWGLFQIYVLGTPLRAESAGFEMHSEHGDILGFAHGVPRCPCVLVRVCGADRR